MSKLRMDSSGVETVRGFLAATTAADYDQAFDKYARPEFSWVVGSTENPELQKVIPWAGHRHEGKEGYMRLAQQLFSEFESLSFDDRAYSEVRNQVFVEGHLIFRHRLTGKIVDSDWLARFTLKDGLIAEGHIYENTFAVAAARS